MTKINRLVVAAFLMASTSSMAFGQTTTPPPAPGTAAPTSTGTTGNTTGTTTTGTAMEGENHSQLITSLVVAGSSDRDWEEEIGKLSDDAEVKIVRLSELKETDGADTMGLDQALNDLEEGQSDLRSAIEDNDNLTSALEDEDYSADDVVAAVMQPGMDNEVTLIIDDNGND